ncbi:hypothetical protein D3C81_1699210 [compost metagenome]
MVSDQHQIPGFERPVHAAASIGDDQRTYAQLSHYINRQHNFAHFIAFIIVETALHDDYILAFQLTDNEPAGMAFHRGMREMRNFFVRQVDSVFDLVAQITKARTKN